MHKLNKKVSLTSKKRKLDKHLVEDLNGVKIKTLSKMEIQLIIHNRGY